MKIEAKEIFGGEIQYFRVDPQYWERIIREFKATGLRTITSYVPWEAHMVGEPDAEHPAGTFDFTGKTDPRLNLMYFLELIEKYELNFNFRCGPFCCAEMPYGGHPRFIVMDMPEINSLTSEDLPTKGYTIALREPVQGQPSYLHPKYLEIVKYWIDEVDKIIIPHLKVNGGCITMINLDNEVSYICQDSFLASDYNPVNVAPGGFYHQYLKELYGTPDKLPYRTRYASFEEVPAPRSVPEEIGDDFAYYSDWAKFSTWTMSRFIEELRKMHEANGITADKVIFMTNYDPHLPEGVPTRMSDFEEATHGITGFDFYRGTFMSYSGYQSLARVLKLMTHTLKFPYSAEFMGGTWNKILNGRVSDDHMRFMSRCAYAHGCKAIDWYMFHDRDTWNDSPVSLQGHKRSSIEVLNEVGTILFGKIKNWDALKPAADISIVYDLTAHIHTTIGDPMPCADNNLPIGNPTVDGVSAGIASKEYIGLFRLAEQNGVQAAVVDILYDDKALYNYPLTVYPGSPVVSHDTEDKLLKYVEAGGILVVTGVLPTRYDIGQKCNFLGGLNVGVNVIGKGKVIVVGKAIAQGDSEQDSMEDIATFGKILDECGIVPLVRISCEPCSWVDWAPGGGTKLYEQPRMLGSAVLQKNGDGENILFVLNHYPDAHTFKLDFSFPCSKLVCLTEEEDAVIENGSCKLCIDRKNCQIYRVE